MPAAGRCRATAEAFAEYASVVAGKLGDRVHHIITHNEPHVASNHGYRGGEHAPGRTDSLAAVAASHHLLVGHGLAVEAIRAAAPQAQVGIVLNFTPKHPATSHLLDQEAAAVANDQENRWYLDPITGRGYPEDGLRDWGWDCSEILDGDMALIASLIDFLGVNYYTRNRVRSPFLPALDTERHDLTLMGWEVYPEGLTETLEFVASRTGDLPLYITENGASYPADDTEPTKDPERVSYLRSHLGAALDAIERGVPLRGYFVWSLMDNFEWAHGFHQRFGIVHVDYDTLERKVRDSGRFWGSVARSGELTPV